MLATIETTVYQVIRDRWVVLAGVFFLWKWAVRLVGMWSWLSVIWGGVLFLLVGYIVRKELLAWKVYRWSHRLSSGDWLLLASILLSWAILMRYRAWWPSKFMIAWCGWLLVYTIWLLSKQVSWKEILTKASWILFAGLTWLMWVWASVNWWIERMDDHTIEKIVVKEKEKIVYVEKEVEKEVVIDENQSEKQEIQDGVDIWEDVGTWFIKSDDIKINDITPDDNESENIADEEQVSICGEWSCLWIDECVDLPENASCTDGIDDAWLCDAWFTEKDGVCSQVCSQDECKVWIWCVERPFRAFCVETGSQWWKCEWRYTQRGNECVLTPVAPIINIVQEEPVLVPVIENTIRPDIWSFINPPTILERAQENDLTLIERAQQR